MPGTFAKAALLATAFVAVANAQTSRKRAPREVEHPAPAVPADKRDSVVAAGPAGATGHAYWFGLAQCGGIYFKLNTLYADAAAHARVVKPDARATAEFTKKLTEAIKTATTYFDAAERFLMTDRGLERTDAVLIYDPASRAAGDRYKTIDMAVAGVKNCPALYQACKEAYPRQCNEKLAPAS